MTQALFDVKSSVFQIIQNHNLKNHFVLPKYKE